jgi:predicted phage terminase large subunit-like protein
VRSKVLDAWPTLPDVARAKLAAVDPILWASYASAGVFRSAPHLEHLADVLLRVEAGEINRVAISTPPQHGKSWLVSKFFPTWYLGRHPEHRVLLCSYGQDLTVEWTGEGRDLLAEHGPAVFGVETWARAKRTAWDVYRHGRRTGGRMRGVGRGGGVTGKPVDLGICDDLVKDAADVASAAMRQQVWRWFESAVLPRARRLIVMATRWHHDDVIGRLMDKQKRGEVGEPWTFVNIPAVAEDDDPIGRPRGEPLWLANPQGANGDADWYAKKQREVGPYVWSALYQGRPTPETGLLFQKEWLRYYDEEHGHYVAEQVRTRADGMLRFVTVDPAWTKKTTADYSVVMSWALDRENNRLFLLRLKRARMNAPELVAAIQSEMEASAATLAYVEAQNLRLDEMQQLRRSGVPMREIQPNTDKVARFMPVQAHAARGALLFPRQAPWLADLERELLEFGPSCEHDDQADCVSYGVHVANMLVVRRTIQTRPRGNREGGGWVIGRE